MWFVNAFDPQKDILYGIGSQITKYLLYYFRKKNPRIFYPMDIREHYSYTAINKYNMPITRTDLSMNQNQVKVTTIGSEEDDIQSNYIEELGKSKYRSATVVGDYFDKWDSLKKSNVNLQIPFRNWVPKNEIIKKEIEILKAAKDLAIRRSSKFGIEYISRSGNVHYILDEVDMNVVVDKSTMTNTSLFTKIPIVTSELRYLFRNWNKYKNINTVFFYLKYNTVNPPWQTSNQAGWAAYAIHRVNKFKINIQANANAKLIAFDSVKNGTNFAQIIAAFHDIPYQYVNS